MLRTAKLIVTPHAAMVQTLQDMYPNAGVRFAPAGIAPKAHDAREVHEVLHWPPTGDALTDALAAMAAGKAVVVFETEETADWPALNPQTWQSRNPLARGAGPFGAAAPIVVSIDPRDEQHSLKLAMRRLSSDAALRNQLGSAAREWWKAHATVAHAAAAWREIIAEARTLQPPPLPADWAPEDGTARAREILADCGVSVDFL
jgi:hypothetical protein